MCRGVVPGGAGGGMAPPDFGRSVNPISTRRGRLCPPYYYWHPQIFRPSYGPGLEEKTSIKALSGAVYTELLINYGETVHTQIVYN